MHSIGLAAIDCQPQRCRECLRGRLRLFKAGEGVSPTDLRNEPHELERTIGAQKGVELVYGPLVLTAEVGDTRSIDHGLEDPEVIYDRLLSHVSTCATCWPWRNQLWAVPGSAGAVRPWPIATRWPKQRGSALNDARQQGGEAQGDQAEGAVRRRRRSRWSCSVGWPESVTTQPMRGEIRRLGV